MNQQSKLEFNSLDLLGFLWNKRKFLIIIGLIAAITSSIISLLIEEKYESVVTLYPAKSSSVTFNEVTNEDQSVSKFGEEEEAEQMLQILESSFIRNEIINKFQLLKHYEINKEDEFAYTDLQETYSDNINFERNKNGAVLIKVLDKNPDTAANIANNIALLFDSTKNAMINERALTDYNIKKNKLHKLKSELQEIRDTMSQLTSIGVVTQDAYQALTEAMINISDSKMKAEYIKKINQTEKYGSILTSFQVEAEFMTERIATMQTAFEQAEADANSSISHKFIVDIAYPAEKKSYPIRWLIVVISTFSTVFFSIILLLFKEKIKELKTA
jgi:uncharacterized protein involved in exopolysaccharide biosynthesis